MQLIVLGMHRSGTSMQTRLLNLAGAYFGPEGSNIDANEENPKGFWERRDIRWLNDTVLHAADCDWNRVAEFDLGRVPEETLEQFSRSASRIVLDMDAHRPWVMKEPRLCLLLPLWRKVLECPVVVNVYRHPLEVASSLGRRNMPLEVGLALWKLYVCAAASAARGMPVVNSFHADFIARPYEALGALLEQLREVGVQGLRMPSRAETEAFVSRELHRERASQVEVDARIAASANELFEALLHTGAVPEGAALDEREIAVLRAFEAGLPPLERVAAPRGEAGKRIAELDEALKLANEGVRRRDRRIRELDEQLHRKVAELSAALTHANEGVQRRDRRIRELDEQLHQKVAELSAALTHANEGMQRRDLRIDELDAEQARLQREFATLDEKARRAEAEAVRERGESARRTLETARLTRLLMAREQDLKEARADLGRIRRALDARSREMAQLRMRFEQLGTRSGTEVAALQAEIERMRRSWSWRLGGPTRRLARRIAAVRGQGAAGDARLVGKSGLFDAAWYVTAYPDVAASGIDPLQHFMLHGAGEGRSPGPGFDTARYLERYPDVADSGMNPLLHFIRHGRDEGRLPN